MRTGIFSTVSAVLVLTAFSASAQSNSDEDDRFKPRVYGETRVAGVIYSEGANTHLNSSQSESGVVKAQHIRQGDVSPEEYNRLLQEADRIKAYKMRMRQSNAFSTPQAPGQMTQNQAQRQPYEIELFESAPLPQTQPSHANYAIQTSASSTGQSYTIVKNDTLYNLSKRFGVEIEDIRAANNIVGNNISLGQKVIIPTGSFEASQNETAIQSRSMNDRTAITGRYEGSVNRIVMPIATEVTANTNSIYAVLPKDTLYSISRQSCIGVNDLIAANGLSDPGALKPGQRLNVPAGHCLPR